MIKCRRQTILVAVLRTETGFFDGEKFGFYATDVYLLITEIGR